jgi:hypothetical protein
VAASPPGVGPEAPVAGPAPPVVPPVAGSTVESPKAAAQPDDAPAATKSSTASTVELASWSVPLAAAGLLAGVVLVAPMVRRQRPAIAPARADSRALPHANIAPPAACGAVVADADDTFRTYPGERRTVANADLRSETVSTLHPIHAAVGTAPNVRLNGAPVPYLRPVRGHADDRSERGQDMKGRTRPGYSTSVSGLSWSEPAADRTDRALA